MPRDIIELLDAWELLDPETDLRRYSVREWKTIGNAAQRLYVEMPDAKIGSMHLGAANGSDVVFGPRPLSDLTVPLLTSEKVWLPDPFYSLMSREAADVWGLMPETGSDALCAPDGKTSWQPFWGLTPDRRKAFVQKDVARTLKRLRALTPLVKSGAVGFFSWQRLLANNREHLRHLAPALAALGDFARVTSTYLPSEYSTKVGPCTRITIDRIGDQRLALANKLPAVLMGLLNASISTNFAASFFPATLADRAVYELIRSQSPNPNELVVVSQFQLPKLSAALWDDVVAIRNSAESLHVIREALSRVAGLREEHAISTVREEVLDGSRKLANDASIWNKVRGQAIDVGIKAIVPVAIACAMPQMATISLAAGIGANAAAFLASLVRTIRSDERQRAATASEVLVRIRECI